jgi:hypothetical protein
MPAAIDDALNGLGLRTCSSMAPDSLKNDVCSPRTTSPPLGIQAVVSVFFTTDALRPAAV